MIRVFIVDDHSVVRRGIVNILTSSGYIEVTGEASNYSELMGIIDSVHYDLLILDIKLPDKSGLDVLIELKIKYPDIKVLVLSILNDEEIVKRAFKTGCYAYLNKDSIPDELLKAVNIVYEGKKYIGTSLAVLADFNQTEKHKIVSHEKLSNREFQIFCLICSGSSLTEIGKKLKINVKTVGTYRARIMEKMNFKSNIELTHYAIKHKLVINQFDGINM